MKMQFKYSVVVTYQDFDRDFDYRLEKAVGRESGGSGFGAGGRDVCFDYVRKDAAERAMKKLKRFKKYSCEVKLYDFSEDE